MGRPGNQGRMGRQIKDAQVTGPGDELGLTNGEFISGELPGNVAVSDGAHLA